MLSAKTFATLYAGREARYEGKKVRVVGYYRVSNTKPMRVIVTGLKGGWKYEDMKNDPAHVFTCRVQAGRIRYATVKDLGLYE